MDVKINVTLCYQYNSEYYSKLDLIECITSAVETANRDIDDYEIHFEDIEESNITTNIHQNIHDIIQRSHIIIFEVSDLSSNVLFELGLAKGSNKKCILLREKSVKTPLPFDISPYQVIRYNSSNLRNFKNQIAGWVKREIAILQPEDIFSSDSIEKIVSKYMSPIRSTLEMKEKFSDLADNSKINLYYLGTMGLSTMAEEDDWVQRLCSKSPAPSIYRIVYLQGLKKIHNTYKNGKVLTSYCIWLSKYYEHIKNNRLKLFSSPDIGIWKAGMSVIVSDESEVLVLTGTFTEFNSKGLWLKQEEIGGIFKEYAKILAVGYSTQIDYLDMFRYFDLGTKEQAKEHLNRISEAKNNEEFESICKEYVEKCFDL